MAFKPQVALVHKEEHKQETTQRRHAAGGDGNALHECRSLLCGACDDGVWPGVRTRPDCGERAQPSWSTSYMAGFEMELIDGGLQNSHRTAHVGASPPLLAPSETRSHRQPRGSRF